MPENDTCPFCCNVTVESHVMSDPCIEQMIILDRVATGKLKARVETLERIAVAAKVIYDAVSIYGEKMCPHGNTTRYPTHVWYCDGCWLELKQALKELEDLAERTEDGPPSEEGN